MANLTEPGVQGYLDELDRALRHLPRHRRQEIIRDVQAHIESALADAPDRSRAVVGAILDDLGTPTEIAAAADAELPATQQRIAAIDVVAIVLLLVGGIVIPIIGWVIGVVLLWISSAWRTTDKIIGTLVVPGGLLVALLPFALSLRTRYEVCEGMPLPIPLPPNYVPPPANCYSGIDTGIMILSIALWVLGVAGPLFTTFWLTRHARRVP